MDLDNNGGVQRIDLKIFSCLRKIIDAVDVYSAKLKGKTGLNASQLSCLLVLGNTGALPLSRLSKEVSLSPSMITSIVDQLESNALVKRTRNSSDRRVILIELTEKGREVVQTSPPSFQEQLMNSLNFLEKNDLRNIHDNLNRLLSIIVSEVLIDSTLLEVENKLVEVSPSVLIAE